MSLRNQDTQLRTLKAAYKPLITKELGKSLDSNTPTYYGDNGVSRELLARTNDVERLTKALASGGGVKFAVNTTLAAGLGSNSGDPKKIRSIGTAAANRAASLLGNAITSGTGYHLGDPIFPYTYLGTSNFFNAGISFGSENTLIGDNPEEGLNTSRKLRDIYNTGTARLFKEIEETSLTGVKNTSTTPENRTPIRVDQGRVSEIVRQQTRKGLERLNLNPDDLGVEKFQTKPSDKSFLPNSSPSDLNPRITSRTDQQIVILDERTKSRDDQATRVYTVKGKPSYDGKIDQLNLLDVTDTDLGDMYDFIKFKMIIKAPGESDSYLYFRSYLVDYLDTYDGQWSGTNYIGRAEPLFNYNGFNRSISFNFMVAAGSKGELLPLYNKLNRLVSTTAPSYSSTFMRGVFVNLTIGDLLADTPGFFTNLSLNWNTTYPWDIGASEAGGNTTPDKKLPTVLDINANFTPVHNFTPAYKQPFLNV